MNLEDLNKSLKSKQIDTKKAVSILYNTLNNFKIKNKAVTEDSDLIAFTKELEQMNRLVTAHKIKSAELKNKKEDLMILSSFLCDDHFEYNKENLILLIDSIS